MPVFEEPPSFPLLLFEDDADVVLAVLAADEFCFADEAVFFFGLEVDGTACFVEAVLLAPPAAT